MDTGCSLSVFRQSDKHLLRDIHSIPPVILKLPTNATLTTTTGGFYSLDSLLIPVVVLPDHLLICSLLSTVDITTAQFTVTLTSSTATITNTTNTPILSIARHTNGLFYISPMATISNVIALPTDGDIARYAHAAFGSPPLQSFLRAINKQWLSNYPNLTAAIVAKHVQDTIATARGHENMGKQHRASSHPHLHHSITTYVLTDADLAAKNVVLHADATGVIPWSPTKTYLLVGIANNYIHAVPLLSRSKTSYVSGYEQLLTFFQAHAHITTIRSDNETSQVVKDFLHTKSLTLQLVEAHMHRANKAEGAIKDLKNHLLSIMSTASSNFPLDSWLELLPQTLLTLNLLRPSSTDSNISAYQMFYGKPYDFIAHPIHILGTPVEVVVSPTIRESFAAHTAAGYYVGPAPLHHLGYRCLMSSTKAIRISSSVHFFPRLLDPTYTNEDLRIRQELQDIKRQLSDLTASPSPLQVIMTPTTPSVSPPRVTPFTTPSTTSVPPPTPAPLPRVDPVVLPPPTLPTAPPFPADQPLRLDFSSPIVIPPSPVQPTQQLARVLRSTRGSAIPSIASPMPLTINTSEFDSSSSDEDSPSIITVPDMAAPTSIPSLTTTKPIASQFGRIYKSNSKYNDEHSDINAIAVLLPPNFDRAKLNMNNNGSKLTYKSAMTGLDSRHWKAAVTEEFVRLIDDYSAIKAIPHYACPPNLVPTYYNPVLKVKCDDTHRLFRVRGTIGGDKIDDEGRPTNAYVADSLTQQILLAAVCSDTNSKLAIIDIDNFYLGSDMSDHPAYMYISRAQLPEDIIYKYKLENLFHKDRVLFKVDKTLYGHSESGLRAQKDVFNILNSHGYHAIDQDPCFFKHISRNIQFSINVDDFSVKYNDIQDLQHLQDTLRSKYTIKTNLDGNSLLGFKLKWDKNFDNVTVSHPTYVAELLTRFNIIKPTKEVRSPSSYVAPIYGKTNRYKSQYTTTNQPIISPALSTDKIKLFQEIFGALNYYAIHLDFSILTAVNKLGQAQAHPTEQSLKDAYLVLHYLAWHPNAEYSYRPCDMILYAHSDASFLSEHFSNSRAAVVLSLGQLTLALLMNIIRILTTKLDIIVGSAGEAETMTACLAGRTIIYIRNLLIDMGYPQPPTLLTCDNETTVGILNETMKPIRSKCYDNRYFWLRDRIRHKQITLTWQSGKTNFADFFTKLHSLSYFEKEKLKFIQYPTDNISTTSNLTLVHGQVLS